MWQSLSLTEEFDQDPDQSQGKVLLELTAKLMQLQRQLYTPYHDARYLRDQLLAASYIHVVQTVLSDRRRSMRLTAK